MRTLSLSDHLIAASLITLVVAVLMAMAQWDAAELAAGEAPTTAPAQQTSEPGLGARAAHVTATILINVGLYGLFFFVVGIGSAVAMEQRGHKSRRAYLALGAGWGAIFLLGAFGTTALRICLGSGCHLQGLGAVLLSADVYLLVALMVVAFAALAYFYRVLAYRKL